MSRESSNRIKLLEAKIASFEARIQANQAKVDITQATYDSAEGRLANLKRIQAVLQEGLRNASHQLDQAVASSTK